jgi:hypothetical protein
MDMSEVLQIIAEQGWTPQQRERRNGLMYLYAAQRKEGRVHWRYIAPITKVEQLTKEDILTQLQKEPKSK